MVLGSGMRRAWIVLLAVAGCGDNLAGRPDAGSTNRIEVVGHADLGARGMNSALALAGDVAYVGSRIDSRPILIVDIADPDAPSVVGELGAPEEALAGMSPRAARAVPELDLLIVMNVRCSPSLHGCANSAAERENLKFFDITDRRAPVFLARYDIFGTATEPRGPHEMFVWRDPADPARVLVFVAAPGETRGYEVVDVTDPALPTQVVVWDARTDGGLSALGADNILHSVSATPDGRTLWMSHQQGGLIAVDQSDVIDGITPPTLTLLTPPAQALHWEPAGTIGPHSAVPVPDRPLLVATEEIYPPPFGSGCPWGHMRVVSADVAAPMVLGEFQVAENDPVYCDENPTEDITFTSHNVTATPHLAIVTWYSAGLQVIGIEDPAAPVGYAGLRPEPLPSVTTEDPALGGNPVLMWSYPIIQDGLIYVTDIRNGLYVLRYHGPYDTEIARERFSEGNSNL
jgi:hypothetical protein